MPKFAIIFGALLIALGLIAYFGSEPTSSKSTDDTSAASANEEGEKKGRSMTAMIPAFFGAPLLILGVVGLGGESMRKHAMHGAAMVGLLGGLAGLGKGGMDLVKLATGQEVNGRAMTFVWLMAVLCIAFVVLCVKSFVDARKKREAEEAANSAS